MTRQTHIAVLTGDIVNSTDLSAADLERAFHALSDCAGQLALLQETALNFSRHRGDGWQVALTQPKYALRSALTLRAALRSLGKEFGTRIASASGPARLPLTSDLNQETQDVFVQSGRLLEMMSKGSHDERLLAHDGGATNAAFILADHISQSWTPAQAQAMRHALLADARRSHTAIAQTLGKSRQAVSKSIDGAGGHALEVALIALEDGYSND